MSTALNRMRYAERTDEAIKITLSEHKELSSVSLANKISLHDLNLRVGRMSLSKGYVIKRCIVLERLGQISSRIENVKTVVHLDREPYVHKRVVVAYNRRKMWRLTDGTGSEFTYAT